MLLIAASNYAVSAYWMVAWHSSCIKCGQILTESDAYSSYIEFRDIGIWNSDMVAASNMVICDVLTESNAPNSRIEQRNIGDLNGGIVGASNIVKYSQNLMLVVAVSYNVI